jgi:hypothetical protein
MWSRQSGTEKISGVTITTGSTMVLDSSGTCDGEFRIPFTAEQAPKSQENLNGDS